MTASCVEPSGDTWWNEAELFESIDKNWFGGSTWSPMKLWKFLSDDIRNGIECFEYLMLRHYQNWKKNRLQYAVQSYLVIGTLSDCWSCSRCIVNLALYLLFHIRGKMNHHSDWHLHNFFVKWDVQNWREWNENMIPIWVIEKFLWMSWSNGSSTPCRTLKFILNITGILIFDSTHARKYIRQKCFKLGCKFKLF